MAQSAQSTANKAVMNMRSPKVDEETQTDLVLYPNHDSVADRYSHLHAQSYKQLEELREACANSMTAVGGTVYDLLAYKDVLLKLEPRLPTLPVNDLLMLTSRLYRETGDLAGLLQAFFQNVFSDGYSDDIFRFTDTRLLKKELFELRKDCIRLQSERDDAVQKYKELSEGLHKHALVVKALEERNDALELKSSALEDQMALLFSQLADDFVFYNEELLGRTADRMNVQQALLPVRSAFSQSVDTINKKLASFQGTLNEIYNDAKINSISTSGDGGGSSATSVKAKLKQLDQHVQQIIQRFSAVKDGLLATSEELVAALKDKKRIINFSLQHIKLFDIQSTKLRASRALMHEIRQRVTTLERTMAQSLINGTVMTINRNGDIRAGGLSSIVERAGVNRIVSDGDCEFASAQPDATLPTTQTVRNVKMFQAQLLELQDAVQKVTAALDTTAEQKAMLKMISLATPSTGRSYGQTSIAPKKDKKECHLYSNRASREVADTKSANSPPADAAELLTSLQAQLSRVAGEGTNLAGANNGGGDNYSFSGLFVSSGNGSFSGANNGFTDRRRSQEAMPTISPSTAAMAMMRQLRSDFINKLDFLRSVYEGQLANYEEQIDALNQIVRKQQVQLATKSEIGDMALGLTKPTTSPPSAGTLSKRSLNPSVLIRLLGLVPSSEGGMKATSQPTKSLIKTWTESSTGQLTAHSFFHLLRKGEVCAWHTITDHDEVWCWHDGSPVELFVGETSTGYVANEVDRSFPSRIVRFVLGNRLFEGQVPQVTIPGGAWRMAALCNTKCPPDYALLSRVCVSDSRTCSLNHLENVSLLSDTINGIPDEDRNRVPSIFDTAKAVDANAQSSATKESITSTMCNERDCNSVRKGKPVCGDHAESHDRWVATCRDFLSERNNDTAAAKGKQNFNLLHGSQETSIYGARLAIGSMINAAQHPAAHALALEPGSLRRDEPNASVDRAESRSRHDSFVSFSSSGDGDQTPVLMTRARGATHAPEGPKSTPMRGAAPEIS